MSKAQQLSAELGMSPSLAKDILILAGGDEDIVREASSKSDRLESMKCRIIDMRMSKIEGGAHHEEDDEV